MSQKLIQIIFQGALFLFTGLLFYGGLGINVEIVYKLGILMGGVLLAFTLLLQKRIVFPLGFLSYILFLLLFGLSLSWSQDRQVSLNYLMLFIGGGLFWLVFYNLRERIQDKFGLLLIVLGIFFGGLYVVFKLLGGAGINHLSLYLPTSGHFNHNHIGDLWTAALVVIVFLLLKEKKWIYLILTTLGIYFLIMSFSRSAYVAFAGGLLYAFWREGWLKKYKKTFWTLAILIAVLFLSASTQKTLLFSRPYFVQAVAGIVDNPLGIGVGNFEIISRDPAYKFWEIESFSYVTHNVVLEILVGMGVFGLVFVFWLAQVTKDILQNTRATSFVSALVFITLGINFLFDYTYFIPTMLWLWFISLGLSQNKTEALLKKRFKGVGKTIKKIIRTSFINIS